MERSFKILLLYLIFNLATIEVGFSKLEDPYCFIDTWTNDNIPSDSELFKYSLGYRESLNNYKIVNHWGYLGKYQFSRVTLRGLGYKGSFEEFLNSPDIQETYFILLLQHNKKLLKNHIELFENTKRDSILLTESGILAAAHLVGYKNVQRYLEQDYIKRDGLGTPITEYLYLFQGYDISELLTQKIN